MIALRKRTLAPALILVSVIVSVIALGTPAVAETTVTRKDGKTVVKAPTTQVETGRTGAGRDRTKVRVRAPHTAVDVDTARRHVRIRVPYYSGDIRW